MALRPMFLLLAILALPSCVSLPPEVYGATYHVSPAERDRALAVARNYLTRNVPGYHVFRLWIESDDEVHVYYRVSGSPARHIILRRTNGKWHVTNEQVRKAYPQEEVQNMTVTP
jgi:hypothetical protein